MMIQISMILIFKENKSKNWLGYIVSVEKTYRSFINDVKPLYSQLDSEYAAAISEIEQYAFLSLLWRCFLFNFTEKAQQESKQNIDAITFESGLEDFFLSYTINLKLCVRLLKNVV